MFMARFFDSSVEAGRPSLVDAPDRSDRLVAPPFDGARAGRAGFGDGISPMGWKRAGHPLHRIMRMARNYLSESGFAGLAVPELLLVGRSSHRVPGTPRREHEFRMKNTR